LSIYFDFDILGLLKIYKRIKKNCIKIIVNMGNKFQLEPKQIQFNDNRFRRTIIFYGNLTGTLSTGLALLRVVDPDFKTPVATDYMYASGITFVLVIPLILMLNLPGYWYTTGNSWYLWLTFIIIGAYVIFSILSYSLLAGRRGFRRASSLWLED